MAWYVDEKVVLKVRFIEGVGGHDALTRALNVTATLGLRICGERRVQKTRQPSHEVISKRSSMLPSARTTACVEMQWCGSLSFQS